MKRAGSLYAAHGQSQDRMALSPVWAMLCLMLMQTMKRSGKLGYTRAMNRPPQQLYRSAQVAAMDREATQALDIPGELLMQRAGGRAYELLRETWPGCRRLRLFCGTGNNGGDGYVIALLGLLDGLDVLVLQPGDPDHLAGDAAAMAERYRNAGGREQGLDAGFSLEPPCDRPSAQEPGSGEDAGAGLVLVDALFGTGLDRPLKDAWLRAVECMNQSPAPVLAIDIPSGLHGDSGQVLGAAVEADVTITFIALKRGLYTAEGPAQVGRLHYAGLDLPSAARDSEPAAALRLDYEQVRGLLPRRRRTAHKGQHGHVLVAGGNHAMGGAVSLAGQAALRGGAGLVSVATREQHVSGLLSAVPELMVHALVHGHDMKAALSRATLVLVGPGLGRDDWGQAVFTRSLASKRPLVLDADALNLLAANQTIRQDWVLTPHPGEAATLLGTDAATVQADRFAAAEALVTRYGGVVVLKGAGTIIAGGGRLPAVCDGGNPGLASGGTGDVLGGLIAALRAQGLSPRDAAEAGVCVHARAADQVARRLGERGMRASDLFADIHALVNP